MAINYKNILDAFQPTKEISDPSRFSGRKQQVERGAELLLSGDHAFIHGIRGIGKSSLARQLSLIASGKKDLLVGINSPLAQENFDYVTCFITRDSSIKNINQLLYRILIDEKGLAQWNELLGFDELGTYDLEGGLNTKLVSDFWNRVGRCATLSENGVAIFIDEFELIDSHEGFASLIKANQEKCVFVVTGIGLTERDLIRDHKSIDRQIDTGKLQVPDMSEDELRSIIVQAQEHISNEMVFEAKAVDYLVKIVKGHPYLLHLVGKHALLLGFKQKQNVVTVETLNQALEQIAVTRADRYLEDRYLKAIGNSPQRESVLRIFACSDSKTLHTSQAYPEAERQGINNPSYWVADLQKETSGSELEKVAEQYYQFRDPLFRAYVAATPRRLGSSNILEEKGEVEKQSEFVLIHVSDIHFGSKHYFSNLPVASDSVPQGDIPSLAKYMVEGLNNFSHPGDFLAVTGDVTQMALTEEFECAAGYIKEITAKLKDGATNQTKNVCIVPGNHDVNWSIQQSDPKARYLGFIPYIRFRSSLGVRIENQVEPERLYEIVDLIDKWNCVIVGFNSAVLEGPDDHRGYIGESQFRNVMQEVEALTNGRNVFKIALLHHHLTPVHSLESSIKGADEILRDAPFIKNALMENGFSLVLHGHRHFGHEEMIDHGDEYRKLVIVGCGSTGVVNSERDSQPLQFNRISIRKVHAKGAIAITVVKLFFDPVRRRWLQSEDHKPKTFRLPLPAVDD